MSGLYFLDLARVWVVLGHESLEVQGSGRWGRVAGGKV